MTNTLRSPADLRSMFGANLRRLAKRYPSVSELCRQLGINRTQFNRYLSGESFPRPDVLDRMCRFFEVDARILLHPLEDIEPHPRHHPTNVLEQFLAAHKQPALPPGFLRMTEAHPQNSDENRTRLLFVRRVGQHVLVRGYEPRAALPGSPTPLRELQGIVCRSDAQVCILMSRRGGQDCRVVMVSEQPGSTTSRWTGHTTYLTDPQDAQPLTRPTCLRHLGDDLPAALDLCRSARRPEPSAMQDEHLG